nr:hypothetical protein [Rhodopirellula sp. SM50]
MCSLARPKFRSAGKGWGPGIWQGIDGGKSGFKDDNPAGHAWAKRTLKPPYKGISHTDYAANFEDFLNDRLTDQDVAAGFVAERPTIPLL